MMNLKRFSDRMKSVEKVKAVRSHIVFGDDESQQRSAARVLSWRHVPRLIRG